MLRFDLPVSSNTSLSWSPFKRLTPLNEESCEVESICARMLLYWPTRFEREVWATVSWTGLEAVENVRDEVSVPPIAPPAALEPMGEDAQSLVVETVSRPLASIVAVRLLA